MYENSNKKIIIILMLIIFLAFGFIIGQINMFFKILRQVNLDNEHGGVYEQRMSNKIYRL